MLQNQDNIVLKQTKIIKLIWYKWNKHNAVDLVGGNILCIPKPSLISWLIF